MTASNSAALLRAVVGRDDEWERQAAAIQHCLAYLADDLRDMGIGQSAAMLEDAIREIGDACEKGTPSVAGANLAWPRMS